MSVEKRCICEKDFVELVMENQNGYNPFKYNSKQDMAQQVWQSLIKDEECFYEKYGYVDIIYDKQKNTYSRKRIIGRPTLLRRKDSRLTIRLSDEQLLLIDKYCEKNGLSERTEVIRIALHRLLHED